MQQLSAGLPQEGAQWLDQGKAHEQYLLGFALASFMLSGILKAIGAVSIIQVVRRGVRDER